MDCDWNLRWNNIQMTFKVLILIRDYICTLWFFFLEHLFEYLLIQYISSG